MKRTKKHLKVLTLGAILTIGAISVGNVYAQEQVYRYSEVEVKEAINAVAKSYAKNDLEKQDRYRKVLEDAFSRYWSLPEAQSEVGPTTLEELKAKGDSLTSVLSAKGNPQVEIDSLAILLQQYQTLTNQVNQQHQQLQSRQKEIGDVNTDITKLDSELSDVKARNQKFSQAQDSLRNVADNLLQVYKKAQSKEDFSEVEIDQIEDAINEYISCRKSIETFNVVEDVSELDNTVKGLEALSSLKLLVDDAIEAMAAKYVPSRNKALIDGIRLEASNPGPTPSQKQLLTTVATALQNQADAVDNFLSILSALPKDYYCVPDDETRNSLHLDQYIIEKVQAFNNSSDGGDAVGSSSPERKEASPSANSATYNSWYVQLNDTLSELLDDLSPNSKMPISKINTDEKFQKYLQSIANKVK